ncbi:MAG: hypothetical protein ACTSU0_12555, partial [Alphaproteobacteria bacterium]
MVKPAGANRATGTVSEMGAAGKSAKGLSPVPIDGAPARRGRAPCDRSSMRRKKFQSPMKAAVSRSTGTMGKRQDAGRRLAAQKVIRLHQFNAFSTAEFVQRDEDLGKMQLIMEIVLE